MYFQKVAELEHLTKAAEALHIAQPALSRTIRSMEEELDVSLFTHQGRNIHLTRDGHILLKYTNKILRSLDDLRQEVTCTACGAKTKSDNAFCPKCGAKLPEKPAPAEEEPVAAEDVTAGQTTSEEEKKDEK